MRINLFLYQQLEKTAWPPTCLRMVAKQYRKAYSLAILRKESFTCRQGESVSGISYAAEAVGLRTAVADARWVNLEKKPLPGLTCLFMFFFDGKRSGELGGVQSFIVVTIPFILFMLVNLPLFTISSFHYYSILFSISFIGSTLYVLWLLLALKKRKQLEDKRFKVSSGSQMGLIRLIKDMQKIKNSSVEKQHRWNWEIKDAGKSTVTIQSI